MAAAAGGPRSISSSGGSAAVVEGRVAADEEWIVRQRKGDAQQQLQKFRTEEAVAVVPPLKSGRLIDQLLYREKFVIRCYEVGTNRTASMETMANLLQVCPSAEKCFFLTMGVFEGSRRF